MKFDKNIWQGRRDVGRKPTRDLVQLVSQIARYVTVLGLVAGACFALAWSGGTDYTRSWQFVVFGSMALFGIAVGCLADSQLTTLIQRRMGNLDEDIPTKVSQCESQLRSVGLPVRDSERGVGPFELIHGNRLNDFRQEDRMELRQQACKSC